MLLTNLKVFLKFLGRSKVYTFVTVAGFSVSLMFTIVLGLYVRQELSVDRFHENGDRIYMATVENPTEGTISAFGNPIGPWLAENYPDVEGYVRVMSQETEIERADGEVLDVRGMLADSTFFNVFSFPLLEGDPARVLSQPTAMVVTPAFAGRMFGTENPIGKSVRFADTEFTVSGVMEPLPRNTLFPEVDFVCWYGMLDALWGYEVLNNHNNSSWPLFVVEREGGDISAYREDMAESLKSVSWIFERGFSSSIDFVPLKDVYFGGVNEFELEMNRNSLTGVMLYLGIALLILVVALLNYVNMTVAQAGFRGREVALRKLHGASRGMIVTQLLVESLTVTAISFGIGLFLAFAMEPFFDGVLNTELDLAGSFSLPVVGVIVMLIALLAVVSGAVPAAMMSRFKPIEIVQGGFSRRVKGVYSRVLAAFQYAVSIGLLICSALIVMQSRYLSTRDVGLTRDGVMIITNGYGSSTETAMARKQTLRSTLSNIAGVEMVSMTSRNPFNSWGGNSSFNFEGEALSFETFSVDSTFFRLFGVTWEPTGTDPNASNAIYLNRPGYLALRAGERNNQVAFGGGGNITPVAGILSDFNFRPLHEQQGLFGLRIAGDNEWAANFIAVKIAAGSDLVAVADKVVKEYASITGADINRVEWSWADDTVREFYETERRTSRIMGAFTVLVILIMLMGIFAMSIYLLRQKEKEIALRRVNGSTIGEILALLSRQSALSVAVAFVAACPVAWWAMSRWLESFPYRIELASTWWVFALAGGAVWLLTLVCVGWQSYKAASANPVKALKSE
ncbi:MAG: FtsX-like permease family protein [Alistipes sp.]|jgi:putative ABC transport system permease protein|nr:FtsX-like permease family protein [Alistipes sp.]